MPSIIELGLSSLDKITTQVRSMTNALDKIAKPMRGAFLERGLIVEIPELRQDDKRTVATVDGAMVVQQLSSHDLLQVGAVAAEGIRTKKLFSDDGPASFAQYLMEHDGKMDKHGRALMGAQELVMVDSIPHDIRIMDGTWSPAAISILFTLFTEENGSAVLLNYILDQLESETWDGSELPHAIDRIVAPWNYTDGSHGTLVAIGKSDSAATYESMTKKLIAEFNIDFPSDRHLNDRTLASIILRPGEMLIPKSVDNGRMLWRLPHLAANNVTKGTGDLYSIPAFKALSEHFGQHEFYDTAFAIIENILISGYERGIGRISTKEALSRLTDDKWIWTTYFKPSSGGEFHRALRLDMSRPSFGPDVPLEGESIVPSMGDVLSVIDDDTMNESQEPMSQYLADRRAKEISHVAGLTIDHLVSTLETERGVAGVIRNYRT